MRFYVLNYSSWISPGLFAFGFQDITAISHEVNETFNDPFIDNLTPWWLSVDPVEVLSGEVPTYSVAMNGRTCHPQNVALFSWFAFESPSPAHLGAYSFLDETTLTALSPGPLHAGCTP